MKLAALIIISLLCIGLVGAASFVQPESAGQEIEGDYEFRVRSAFDDLSRCNIRGESVIAEDSIEFVLYGEGGTGDESKHAFNIIDTTGIKDASDWQFTGTCTYKDGTKEPVEPLTDIIIDNTKPEVDVLEDFQPSAEKWEFLCVASNTGTVTYGGNTFAMKVHGALCIFDAAEAPEGDFTIKVKVSDGKDWAEIEFRNVEKALQRDPEVLEGYLIQEIKKTEGEEEPPENGWPLLIAIGIITAIIIIVSRHKQQKG